MISCIGLLLPPGSREALVSSHAALAGEARAPWSSYGFHMILLDSIDFEYLAIAPAVSWLDTDFNCFPYDSIDFT